MIQFYDYDKQFPAWGFGGRTVDGNISHCFNLNGSPYDTEVKIRVFIPQCFFIISSIPSCFWYLLIQDLQVCLKLCLKKMKRSLITKSYCPGPFSSTF